jgi:hypothetical protein
MGQGGEGGSTEPGSTGLTAGTAGTAGIGGSAAAAGAQHDAAAGGENSGGSGDGDGDSDSGSGSNDQDAGGDGDGDDGGSIGPFPIMDAGEDADADAGEDAGDASSLSDAGGDASVLSDAGADPEPDAGPPQQDAGAVAQDAAIDDAGVSCLPGTSGPSCTACSTGQFCAGGDNEPIDCQDDQGYDDDDDPATVCMPWTECGPGSIEDTPGTSTSDRTCSPDLNWTIMNFGTSVNDTAMDVAVDAVGDIFVAGYTAGNLEGSNQGGNDTYVRKLDGSDGTEIWTVQFGTTTDDNARGVCVDPDGNVVVIGTTSGQLGAAHIGGRDVFVRKLDGSDGSEMWTQQFGVAGTDDYGIAVAADANGDIAATGRVSGSIGDTFVSGYDFFVRKMNGSDGTAIWTKQRGASGSQTEEGRSVVFDSWGDVIATGITSGDLGGTGDGEGDDVFVLKLQGDDGDEEWVTQYATGGNDDPYGIDVDSNDDVLVGGTTLGGLGTNPTPGNARAAFAFKLTGAAGDEIWLKLLDGPENDDGYNIAVDAADNVVITGRTEGDLDGDGNKGLQDLIVHSFAGNDGSTLWTEQLGTAGREEGWGIDVAPNGVIFVAGYGNGNLGGPNPGGYSAILVAIEP